MQYRFKFKSNETAAREHLIATGRRQADQGEIKVRFSDADPEVRRIIVEAGLRYSDDPTAHQDLWIREARNDGASMDHGVERMWVAPWEASEPVPDAVTVLRLWQAAQAAENNRLLLIRAEIVAGLHVKLTEKAGRCDSVFDVPQVPEFLAGTPGYESALALRKAEIARLGAERNRREAEDEARVAARDADADAWIKAHGSERLRMLRAGDYDGWLFAYLGERAAMEHPGYELNTNEFDPAHGPSEELLREAARVGGFVSVCGVVVQDYLGYSDYNLLRRAR